MLGEVEEVISDGVNYQDFIRHAKEFGFCAAIYGNALMGFMWEKICDQIYV